LAQAPESNFMSQMKLQLAIKIPLRVRIFVALHIALIQSASLIVDIDLTHQAEMLGGTCSPETRARFELKVKGIVPLRICPPPSHTVDSSL
jgi:hypothetical protein